MTQEHGRKRVRRTDGGPGGAPAPTVPEAIPVAIPPELLPIAPEYPLRTKDKVAIVGFADGHRHLAPFQDPEFEIWGLNRLHSVLPGRYDRWFEIHNIGLYTGGTVQTGTTPPDTEHLEFLRTFAGPVYLRPQDMGRIMCPNAQPYPIEAVLRDFGNYFNNSISYMVAFAIAMRFKEIHLYGVDMAQSSPAFGGGEYQHQRPSCEFLLGIAIGRGIKIYKPPGSDLLIADHLYGFSDGTPMMLKRLARMQELAKRKDKIREQLAQLDAQKAAMESQYWAQKLNMVAAINQQDGAMQEAMYEQSQLSSPPVQEPPPVVT